MQRFAHARFGTTHPKVVPLLALFSLTTTFILLFCMTTQVAIAGIDAATDTPVANPDHARTLPNRPVTISVLANDTNLSHDDLIISRIMAFPAHGQVVIDSDNQSLLYSPELDYVGIDRITYEITDATGLTATASVDVEVTPQADHLFQIAASGNVTDRCCNIVNLHQQVNDTASGTEAIDWFFLDLARAQTEGLQVTLAGFEPGTDQLVILVNRLPVFMDTLDVLNGLAIQPDTIATVLVNEIPGAIATFVGLDLDNAGEIIALRMLDILKPSEVNVIVDPQVNTIELQGFQQLQPLDTVDYTLAINNLGPTAADDLAIRFEFAREIISPAKVQCDDQTLTAAAIDTGIAFNLPRVPAATNDTFGELVCQVHMDIPANICTQIDDLAVSAELIAQNDFASPGLRTEIFSAVDCTPLPLDPTLDNLIALLDLRNRAVTTDNAQFDRNRDGRIDIADGRLFALDLTIEPTAANPLLGTFGLELGPDGLKTIDIPPTTQAEQFSAMSEAVNAGATESGGTGAMNPVILLLFSLAALAARFTRRPIATHRCRLVLIGLWLISPNLLALDLRIEPVANNVNVGDLAEFNVTVVNRENRTLGGYDINSRFSGTGRFSALSFGDSLNSNVANPAATRAVSLGDDGQFNVFEVSQLDTATLATLQQDDSIIIYTLHLSSTDAGEISLQIENDGLLLVDGDGDPLPIDSTDIATIRILAASREEVDFFDLLDDFCADNATSTCQQLNALDAADRERIIRDAYPTQAPSQANAAVNGTTNQASNLMLRLANVRAGLRGFDFGNLLVATHQTDRLASHARPAYGHAVGGGASADDNPIAEKWGVFLNGSLGFGSQNAAAGETGYDFDSQSVTLGTDYLFQPDLVAGIAAGINFSGSDFNSHAGKLDADGFDFSVYGSWYPTDAFYLDLIGSFGFTDYELARRIQGEGDVASITARSDTNGQQWQFGLSSGYTWQRQNFSATPYASLSYRHANVDGYTEKGADTTFLVSLEDQSIDSLQTSLGLQANLAIGSRVAVFLPLIGIEWLHEYKDNARRLQGQSLLYDNEDGQFVITTASPDRNFWSGRIGLSAQFAQARSAFLVYERLFAREEFSRNLITAGLRLAF